tara:strand:+ start:861 stop:1202 length:342 start_codon:yes stop_codon:yes gene_type:complete
MDLIKNLTGKTKEDRDLEEEEKMAQRQAFETPDIKEAKARRKSANQALKDSKKNRIEIDEISKLIEIENKNIEKFSRLIKSDEDKETKKTELKTKISEVDKIEQELYPTEAEV